MLSAHLDTVNLKKYATRGWYYHPHLGKTYDPVHFEQTPVNEKVAYVYGKGAVQAKNLVFGILEALENLLRKKTRPSRTFYIAFSHDTKLDGLNGAGRIKDKMADMLEANEEFVEFVLDPLSCDFK